MKFRQLRIAGFKSFVDPVDIRIEPGLTGVVGPNGCGKSNLFESVRWVMGATSAKALRGAGMEDVIFAGTGRRPARNHAEVTLVIENDEGKAPAPFEHAQELEISRRITRGGGSAYRINGKEMRAKDVQLLFADASTGANSPALVRQGQVSELVSAKPQNRRRVLEEAAGIAGLHARRHEAELKLRAAEANLDRLDEELGRLEGELAKLKRQSRQASRYRRLGAEIRRLEALIQHLKWTAAERGLQEADADLRRIAAEVNETSEEAASARAQASTSETALPEARQADAEASAVLRHVQIKRDAIDRDAREARAELERIEARINEMTASRQREEDIAADAKQALERLDAEAAELSAGAENEAERLQTAKTAHEDAAAKRDEAEARLSDLTSQAAAARAREQAARRHAEQLDQRVRRLAAERDQTRKSLAELDDPDSADQLDMFRAHLNKAQGAAEAAREALERAEQNAEEAAQSERDSQRAFNEARENAGALEAEARGLERALQSEDSRDWEPALARVRAEAGYEHALAAALGDDLNAAVGGEAARQWAGAAKPDSALPAGAKPLSDFVEAPPELAARLSQVGVAEAGAAAALVNDLKPGQRLVSPDGGLWRWDGYRSAAGAPSAAAARLEQRTRLKQLAAEREAAEAALTAAREARDGAVNHNRVAVEALRAARRDMAETDRKVGENRKALDREAGAQAETERKRAALEDRLTRLADEADNLDSELETAQAALAETASDDIDESAIEAAREETNALRNAAAEARAAYDSLRGEAQRRESRLQSIKSDREQWSRRGENAGRRIDELAGLLEEAQNARAAAKDQPDEIEERAQGLQGELKEAEDRAAKAADALAEAEAAAQTAARAAREAENRHAALREQSAAAQQKRAGAEERLEERRAEIEKNLECAPADLPERAGELMEANLTADQAEGQLEKAKRGRESIGEVNLRSDIESQEIEERRGSLEADREDLVAAISKLRGGVEKLNEEGRNRLLEAFEVINGHFQSLFQTLFEGGEAHLELTESEDPLEAGLEIFASPPGKRLAALSLMSGGEQALTATALIFAVFLSNPAPLCVLDEVDAPLDDANVGRFCDMLDEMTRRTQTRFLIITHNAVTMARADRLFGVTMAEQGVSQIVSVDLARAEQLAAAE